jgi:hypothetical protein
LPLNWNILIFYILSLNWYVFNILLWNYLRNIASNMLNCIIISWNNFSWHNIYFYNISIICNNFLFGNYRIPWLIYIISDSLLNWNILDSTLSLYCLFFYSLFSMILAWRWTSYYWWCMTSLSHCRSIYCIIIDFWGYIIWLVTIFIIGTCIVALCGRIW